MGLNTIKTSLYSKMSQSAAALAFARVVCPPAVLVGFARQDARGAWRFCQDATDVMMFDWRQCCINYTTPDTTPQMRARHILDPTLLYSPHQFFLSMPMIQRMCVRNRFGTFVIKRTVRDIRQTGQAVRQQMINAYKPGEMLECIRGILPVDHTPSTFYRQTRDRYMLPDWFVHTHINKQKLPQKK